MSGDRPDEIDARRLEVIQLFQRAGRANRCIGDPRSVFLASQQTIWPEPVPEPMEYPDEVTDVREVATPLDCASLSVVIEVMSQWAWHQERRQGLQALWLRHGSRHEPSWRFIGRRLGVDHKTAKARCAAAIDFLAGRMDGGCPLSPKMIA